MRIPFKVTVWHHHSWNQQISKTEPKLNKGEPAMLKYVNKTFLFFGHNVLIVLSFIESFKLSGLELNKSALILATFSLYLASAWAGATATLFFYYKKPFTIIIRPRSTSCCSGMNFCFILVTLQALLTS